ncbi:MAG: hypothetical protein IKC53_07145 [Lentisphaeria bacterium]|nr:hypothetical protein [Lentisphaeria bacterium]
MIELSAQAIFLQDSHGYAVPFDPDDLAARIRSVLPGNGAESDALARDAVSAVEYALRHAGKPKKGPLYVKASAVDAMIANILQSVGLNDAAAAYGRTKRIDEESDRFQDARIASLLNERFSLSGERLAAVARKVSNTLRSIGADVSSTDLVLELAKHFAESLDAVGSVKLSLPEPGWNDKGFILPPEEFISRISAASARLLAPECRAVKVLPVDLRVFPALRVELRFFPLLRESKLETPVTELAFAPLLAPVAACVDELCIAADDACGRHGGGSLTPLKLLLHFADAEVFASEAMGCAGRKASAEILNGLASFFTGMITRRPEKITCG